MTFRDSIRTAIVFVVLIQVTSAQGPVGDRVMVTFDRTVQIGSQTLPAGEYTVREMTGTSNLRVLEFTSGNGTHLNATVTAISAPQNMPSSETKTILEDEVSGARLSRIWVQGKDYGYEFPGRTPAVTQAGAILSDHRYDTTPSYVRQATAAELAPVQLTTPVLTPAPILVAPAPAPTPVPLTTPVQAPAPILVGQAPAPAPVQLTTPVLTPAPILVAPAPAPAPSPVLQNAPALTDQTPVPPLTNTQPIPSTALGWAPLMFVGLTLAATGLLLFWRAKRVR